MSIRWKLLILLLVVSLVPLLFLRISGERAMRAMGVEIGERNRDMLVELTAVELKRLVEDHARVLKRDRLLYESLARVQALQVAERLAAPLPDERPEVPIAEPWNGPGDEAVDFQVCEGVVVENCVPMQVVPEQQAFLLPRDATVIDDAARLADMTSVYADVLRQLPGGHGAAEVAHDHDHSDTAVIWQITALENGLISLYPGVSSIPRFDPRDGEWYRAAIQSQSPVWSDSLADPVTRQKVLVVSSAVRDVSGNVLGATALVLPAAAFVHENEHIKAISENTTSLMVMAEPDSDQLAVVARENHPIPRGVRLRRQEAQTEYLLDVNSSDLEPVLADMREQKPGVRLVRRLSVENLWAYGPLSNPGMALLLIVPLSDVVASAQEAEDYVIAQVEQQLRQSHLLVGAVLLLIVLASLWGAGRMTRDIGKLAAAYRRLAQGDFRVRVDIPTRDEVGELGRVFNETVPALEERLKIKRTLSLASEIQRNLLPAGPPHIAGLDVAAVSLFTDETGGDFYDYPPGCEAQGGLTVVVGDVSGHGLPAALLMAGTRAMLRATACSCDLNDALGRVVSQVNTLISCDVAESAHLVTLFMLTVDRTGLKWVRAGHDPGLLYDPTTNAFEELDSGGPALGLLPDHAYRSERRAPLTPGQVLCLCTDGLWEARDESGSVYGKNRLRRALKRGAHRDATAIRDAILADLHEFRGKQPLDDDVTLLIIKADPAQGATG